MIFRKVNDLRKRIGKLTHTVSILSSEITTAQKKSANPYPTYTGAIKELSKKYEGTADYGIQQVRNIIDVRSAFIIGNGITVSTKNKNNTRELEFVQEMLRANNLDREMPQELAKEAEIEGRCLIKLIPNKEKNTIDIRFVSYSTNEYTVQASADDYQKYEKVTYKKAKTVDPVTLEENEFVYKKFAGRLHKVNEVMPKVGMVLRQCEDLDKALVDWREINYLFASPTPYIKCGSKAEVEATRAALKDVNWSIGKLLVIQGDFRLEGISGQGIPSIENEIISHAKIISGATGVPVHFLGLPDLMSNRAVSHDLMEFVNASTKKETEIWKGFYEELFYKALKMANAKYQKNYDLDSIQVEIIKFTEGQMKQLTETWLPLYNSRVIPLKTLLSKIPEIDSDEVEADRMKEDDKMLDAVKRAEEREAERQRELEATNAGS